MPLLREALISKNSIHFLFWYRNETIQPNWQKRVWTCWSTLFVEVPPLTVDHAITLDLSIRLHSPTSMKGGEVVKFQWCAARWHLVPIARWILKKKIKHSLFFEVPFWQKNWECVLRRYSFRYPIRMKNKVVYLTERRGINKEQVSILGQNVLSTYISY